MRRYTDFVSLAVMPFVFWAVYTSIDFYEISTAGRPFVWSICTRRHRIMLLRRPTSEITPPKGKPCKKYRHGLGQDPRFLLQQVSGASVWDGLPFHPTLRRRQPCSRSQKKCLKKGEGEALDPTILSGNLRTFGCQYEYQNGLCMSRQGFFFFFYQVIQ